MAMNDGAERFFPATSMPDEDWWRMLWADPHEVLLRLGLRAGMRAVDLCCGYGWFTLPMARMLGEGRVTAVDIEAEMIAAAQARLRRARAPAVVWITGCARELDGQVAADSQDFVLIANTFHGVPEKAALARAVHRVLKSGGLFVVVNWHALPRARTRVLGRPRGPADELRMPPRAVKEIVEPEGFGERACVELPPYHYGVVLERT